MSGVRASWALLGVALVIATSGCGSGRHAPLKEPPSAVRQLQSVSQLRSAFNAHSGVPRLILLISPT